MNRDNALTTIELANMLLAMPDRPVILGEFSHIIGAVFDCGCVRLCFVHTNEPLAVPEDDQFPVTRFGDRVLAVNPSDSVLVDVYPEDLEPVE